MSAKTLPPQANLEQLRKQAKDLKKACAQGDAEAVGRARAHLPRLSNGGGESTDLTLQEAQHVLAKEYGFAKWEELTHEVDYDFARMAWLSDRAAQIMMREIDQTDLVRALCGAPEEIREKFLSNMSERVRRFIESEIEFFGDPESEQVAEARLSMERQARQLSHQGLFTWPPPKPHTPSGTRAAGEPSRPATELHRRPLSELSPEEVAAMIQAFAELARSEGILAMEASEGEIASSFVREGVRLVVDGTEPDLVREVLETRAQTIDRNRRTRNSMIVEGVLAVLAGGNPGAVRYKLETIYRDEPTDDSGTPRRIPRAERGDQVEELRARLGETPPSAMSLDQVTDLFTDLAFLARREGIVALGQLVDLLDDPLLGEGIRLVAVEQVPAAAAIARMQVKAREILEELARRHRMVVAGMAMIQAGRKPADVAEECLAAGRVEADGS